MTPNLPWPVWKLLLGIREFALLEMEKVVEEVHTRSMLTPFLYPADVMVLRPSARQLKKKLELGVNGFRSAPNETSDGRASVRDDKSLVGT